MASVREIKGVFHARFRDEYGHRVERKLPGVTTKREAKRLADELDKEAEKVRRGFESSAAPMTLAELWSLYVKAKARKASLKSDKSRWKTHVKPALGHMKLHTIRPSDVEDMLAAVEASGRSGNTAEKVRMLVAALFTWAIRKKKCFKGENPARVADKPTIVERSKFELEPRFVQPLLDNVRPRWRNLFAASVYTGARAGELKPVRVVDVNISEAPFGMLLSKSNERDVTKGGKNRWVPIPKAAVPYFEAALKASTEIYAALPAWRRPKPGEELLFPSDKGRQLRVDLRLAAYAREACVKIGLIAHYRLACEVCGSEPLTRRDASVELCRSCKAPLTVTPVAVDLKFHSLRATAASSVQAMTGDMRHAQRLLGHADLRTTERYLAKANRHLAEANRHLAEASAGLDFASQRFPTPSRVEADSDRAEPHSTHQSPKESQ